MTNNGEVMSKFNALREISKQTKLKFIFNCCA